MAILSPGLISSYMKERSRGLANVEKLGFTDPRLTAAALLRTRYAGGIWDGVLAPWTFHPDLPTILLDTGVMPQNTGNTTSSRGSIDIYLFHTIAAVGAYGNPSKALDIAFRSFGVDPGIKIGKIYKHYSKPMRPSFMNGLAGDFLTDQIYGYQDEDEYRAGILGLLATRKFLEPDLEGSRLSDIMRFAVDNLDLVLGDNYKNREDFQIALDNLKPIFGHLALRWLTRNFSIFQKGALIPVDRAMLNQVTLRN